MDLLNLSEEQDFATRYFPIYITHNRCFSGPRDICKGGDGDFCEALRAIIATRLGKQPGRYGTEWRQIPTLPRLIWTGMKRTK